MPKVALVFPYFRTYSPTEMLFPPLGLGNLNAQLHVLGIQTRIFDCTFQDFGRVKKDLVAYQPDIVGISSMILVTRNAFRFARTIGERLPSALLVAGGPMPTLYPEHYAGPFDLVFRGEADLSFPDFCRDYLNQGIDRKNLYSLDLKKYPGLFSNTLDLVVNNPFTHYPEETVQAFPIPYREGFDHAKYQQAWLEKDGTRTTSILVTLGCPFSCDFCSRPVFGHVYRRRNLEAVFEEIGEIKRLGYDKLWIADDNFTLDLDFLRQFCARIAGSGIRWSCLSRSSGITEEVAELMKEAGCIKVYLGLETGSNEILKLMNKKTTVEDGVQAVDFFRRAGIQVAAFFIVGYPGETRTSIEQTFRHSLSLPLDEISFNVPFPLPGSDLFQRVSGIDTQKDWSTENEVTFVYSTEFDSRWLRRRIRQTMLEFESKKRDTK